MFPAPWSPRRMWRLAMAAGMAGAGFCLVIAMIMLVVALGGGNGTRPPPGASRTSTSPSDRFGNGHQRYRTTIVYEPRPVAGDGSANAGHYGLGLLVAQFHGVGPARGDRFRITRPGDWGISWQFRCTQGHPGNLTVRADHASTGTGTGNGEGEGRHFSNSNAGGNGNGNGKEPPGQAKKHKKKVPPGQAKKKHMKHKKVPPGQAKKHKHRKKVPPGQARKRGYQAGSGNQNSHVTFSASGYDGRGMSWYTSDPGAHTLVVVSGCSWAIKIVLPKP